MKLFPRGKSHLYVQDFLCSRIKKHSDNSTLYYAWQWSMSFGHLASEYKLKNRTCEVIRQRIYEYLNRLRAALV